MRNHTNLNCRASDWMDTDYMISGGLVSECSLPSESDCDGDMNSWFDFINNQTGDVDYVIGRSLRGKVRYDN